MRRPSCIDYCRSVFIIIRSLQAVLGITVMFIYGLTLNNTAVQRKQSDTFWKAALAVGGVSTLISLVALISIIRQISFVMESIPLCLCNIFLAIGWTVLFAFFCQIFITDDPQGGGDIQLMKNAVWVDLSNMLLWGTASVGEFVYLVGLMDIPKTTYNMKQLA